MTPDWHALAPHRPVDPGESAYVDPPGNSALEIAKWIRAGRNTVVLGGPTGVGKSTAIARAATLLSERGRLAVWLPLDRTENMRRFTVDDLRWRVAGVVARLAIDEHRAALSADLRRGLFAVGALGHEHAPAGPPLAEETPVAPLDLLRHTLLEVARVLGTRLLLLIDGLEKLPEGESSRAVLDALAELPDDVDIVTVVPWHAAFSPGSTQVLRPGEKFVSVRACRVLDGLDDPGQQFLRSILEKRLSAPGGALDPKRPRKSALPELEAFVPLVAHAAMLSGGLPRTFLQLVADAATYARIERGADWPQEGDLKLAAADQTDSLRRILLPGDKDLINRIRGTDGTELPPAARVRLLAQGLLLERIAEAGDTTERLEELLPSPLAPTSTPTPILWPHALDAGDLYLEPHPLLEPVLDA